MLSAGVAGLAALVATKPAPALARGLEEANSFTLDDLPSITFKPAEIVREIKAESQGKVDRAEAAFEESDLLANLLAKTEANRDSNTKAIEEKYCQRGAEWGVGDCGGLQLIPGMTKSGKQKLPFGLGE